MTDDPDLALSLDAADDPHATLAWLIEQGDLGLSYATWEGDGPLRGTPIYQVRKCAPGDNYYTAPVIAIGRTGAQAVSNARRTVLATTRETSA